MPEMPVDQIERSRIHSAMPLRTIIFSLDYDGCMDCLFEGAYLRLSKLRNIQAELKRLETVRADIIALFERITVGASRVILMLGSNRQSVSVDSRNRAGLERLVGPIPSNVGWARTDFVNFATKMGWELNKVLLADKVNGVAPGTGWDDADKDWSFVTGEGRDERVKKELLEFQFEQLSEISGPIDFYFFDDKVEYIDYAREQLVKDRSIPSHVSFFTVHFDSCDYVIDDRRVDLQAVDVLGQLTSLMD
jgi:hypothetical protein